MSTIETVDVAALKRRFPIFERQIDGAPLHYLDSANTSQKPVEVLMPAGRIDARRLEITGGGDLVTFGGGVTMTVKSDVSPITASTEP